MVEHAMSWIVGRSGDWLSFLVAVSVKSAVVLAFAFLATLLLRRASAATRHQIWLVAVVSALTLPLLALMLPRLAVPVPGLEVRPGEVSRVREVSATPLPPRGLPPASRAVPTPAPAPRAMRAPRPMAAPRAAPQPPPPAVVVVTPGAFGRPGGVVVHSGERFGPFADVARGGWSGGFLASDLGGVLREVPWALLGLIAWGAGAWLVLAAVLAGVVRVQWLGWRLPRFGGRCAALARSVADELGLGPVEVLRGPSSAMPMTWGLIQPAIVLPSSAAEWPIERLDAVLRHELAHVRRRDTLTQLIADVACAIYWFNPLVWIAAHRLRIEREHACDDEVLAAGSRPSDYAEQLLLLTRSLRVQRATSLTAIAMARPTQLHARLHALLDEDRSRARLSRGAATRGWLAAAVFVLPLAMLGLAPGASASPFPNASAVSHEFHADDEEVFILPPAVTIGVVGVEPVEVEFVGVPPLFDGDSRWLTPPPAIRGVAVAPAAPLAMQVQRCWDAQTGKGSLNIRHSDDVREITWKNDRCRARVRIEGAVEFTEDFSAIAGLSRGGEVLIEEDDGRTERALEIFRDGDGLAYEYRLNGREHPFDAPARAWFDDMLLQLFRTGFAAEERVAWMLGARGLDAVIQEIGQLHGSYARRIYYQAALADRRVSNAQAASLIRSAGTDITSDYELAELLIATSETRPFDDAMSDAFLDASKTIDSDYEHRRVLARMLEGADLSDRNVATMLESADAIGSDYERAELLVALAKRGLDTPALRSGYMRAATAIRSDYEKRRALDAVIGGSTLGADDAAAVLDAAASLRSDYERAELLLAVARSDLATVSLQRAYVRAAGGIGSDYEHRRALSALLSKQQLTGAAAADALRTLDGIGSDYEKAELLVEFARTQPLDEDARAAFMQALEAIRSSHEHGRVSSALLRSGGR